MCEMYVMYVCDSVTSLSTLGYHIAGFCREDFNLAKIVAQFATLEFMTILSVTFYNSRY